MNDELKEKIRHLAEPVISAEGMELIHVECLKMNTRWIIRLYLDKENGANLDDCSTVSSQLGDILDVNDMMKWPYTLEVSSPGLDRPISRSQDFLKYKGCKVKIKTVAKIEGIKNFHGTIVDLLGENDRKIVVVDVAGKLYNISMAEIAKANLAADV